MSSSTLGSVMSAAAQVTVTGATKPGTSILPSVTSTTPTISIVAQPAPTQTAATAQLPAATTVQLSVTPTIKTLTTSLTSGATQTPGTPVRISILPSPQGAASLVNPSSAITQVVSVTPTTPVTTAKVTVQPSTNQVEKATTAGITPVTTAITIPVTRTVAAGIQATSPHGALTTTTSSSTTVTVVPTGDQTVKPATTSAVDGTAGNTASAVATTVQNASEIPKVEVKDTLSNVVGKGDQTLVKKESDSDEKATSDKSANNVKSEGETADGVKALEAMKMETDQPATKEAAMDTSDTKTPSTAESVKEEKKEAGPEPMDTTHAPVTATGTALTTVPVKVSSVNGELIKPTVTAVNIATPITTTAPAISAVTQSSTTTTDASGKLIGVMHLVDNLLGICLNRFLNLIY